METCITQLPEVSNDDEVAGGELQKWPERSFAVPPRIRGETIHGITQEKFEEDNKLWKVDYKFDEGLKRENVLEADTNVNYISRYTPKELENLGEFIDGFFHGLPRISIIFFSLLDGDYVNLLGEMLTHPSFFPAWLLITRFDPNRQPIVMFFPLVSISEGFDSCKNFMLENMISVADWPCPWSSAVIDDVAPSYRLILATNALYSTNPILIGAAAHFEQTRGAADRLYKRIAGLLDIFLIMN